MDFQVNVGLARVRQSAQRTSSLRKRELCILYYAQLRARNVGPEPLTTFSCRCKASCWYLICLLSSRLEVFSLGLHYLTFHQVSVLPCPFLSDISPSHLFNLHCPIIFSCNLPYMNLHLRITFSFILSCIMLCYLILSYLMLSYLDSP